MQIRNLQSFTRSRITARNRCALIFYYDECHIDKDKSVYVSYFVTFCIVEGIFLHTVVTPIGSITIDIDIIVCIIFSIVRNVKIRQAFKELLLFIIILSVVQSALQMLAKIWMLLIIKLVGLIGRQLYLKVGCIEIKRYICIQKEKKKETI